MAKSSEGENKLVALELNSKTGRLLVLGANLQHLNEGNGHNPLAKLVQATMQEGTIGKITYGTNEGINSTEIGTKDDLLEDIEEFFD